MAVKLIARMQQAFEPQKYKDSYRESVMQMITEKVNNYASEANQMHKYTDANAALSAAGVSEMAMSGGRLAPVVDIMTALKRSLERSRVGSPAGSAASRSNVSEKPHANAHRDARGKFARPARGVRASGA
jgi:non-homologous end joining protein Ku